MTTQPRSLAHDSIVCGLPGYYGPPPCPACAALERDAMLAAMSDEWPAAPRDERVESIVRRVLVEELPAAVAYLIARNGGDGQ
jgi:hypothetical protein